MEGITGLIVNIIFAIVVIVIAIYAVIDIRRKMVNKGETKKTYSSFQASALSRINFPISLDTLSATQIRDMVKDDLKVVKALEYYKVSDEDLVNAKEWHTYQISIMLRMYYLGEDLRVFDKEKYFPKEILDMEKSSVKHEVDNIMERYINSVNPGASEAFLKKDRIWSARDALVILYHLSIYQD